MRQKFKNIDDAVEYTYSLISAGISTDRAIDVVYRKVASMVTKEEFTDAIHKLKHRRRKRITSGSYLGFEWSYNSDVKLYVVSLTSDTFKTKKELFAYIKDMYEHYY